MKRFVVYAVLAVFAVSATSCDFLRKMAGRPTSDEIEAKRAAIEEVRHQKEQRALDSLDIIRQQEADSVAAVAELSEMADIVHSSIIGGMDNLEKGYYIIVGTFSQISNARKLASHFSDCGFSTTLLPYKKGMTAVALCPTDSVVELRDCCLRLNADESAPAGMWVLVKD